MKDTEIRKAVRESYGRIAVQAAEKSSCCGGSADCGSQTAGSESEVSRAIGYSEAEMGAVPEGANLGLGCGNPTALASLKEGEVVLDLGSGGGFDCFLAAAKVGENGRVIGVDMTPEMIEKARTNAEKGGYGNVEFRLGEIENLPVADASVDVIISNCVINLSTDKKRVFREAFRALKPGGRISVSDIALLRELPESIRGLVEAYVGCVAGATTREEYLATVSEAGFRDVRILKETFVENLYSEATVEQAVRETKVSPDTVRNLAKSIVSLQIQAVKPE